LRNALVVVANDASTISLFVRKIPAVFFLLEFIHEIPVQKFKLLLTDLVSCVCKDAKLRYEARESDVIQFPLLRDARPKWIHIGTNGNSTTDLAVWRREASFWSDIRKFQTFWSRTLLQFLKKHFCLSLTSPYITSSRYILSSLNITIIHHVQYLINCLIATNQMHDINNIDNQLDATITVY